MLHAGAALGAGEIAIAPPDVDEIRAALCDDDVAQERTDWLAICEGRPDSLYFSVHRNGQLVGQIFLHDRDDAKGESLVGYHLFRSGDRGGGIGTAALRLLRDWALEHTSLMRLVVITSEDNVASRRAAEKAGFRYVGRPHEDQQSGRVYEFRR